LISWKKIYRQKSEGMPESLEIHIKSFQSKLQQLLKKHSFLEKENAKLSNENRNFQESDKELKGRVALLEQQVSILKTSMGTLANQEKKDFEKIINEYIKTIDKCISVLNK
jgi:chromosome segregation ATPase